MCKSRVWKGRTWQVGMIEHPVMTEPGARCLSSHNCVYRLANRQYRSVLGSADTSEPLGDRFELWLLDNLWNQ